MVVGGQKKPKSCESSLWTLPKDKSWGLSHLALSNIILHLRCSQSRVIYFVVCLQLMNSRIVWVLSILILQKNKQNIEKTNSVFCRLS